MPVEPVRDDYRVWNVTRRFTLLETKIDARAHKTEGAAMPAPRASMPAPTKQRVRRCPRPEPRCPRPQNRECGDARAHGLDRQNYQSNDNPYDNSRESSQF